jgi:anti-sigma factor RsiW
MMHIADNHEALLDYLYEEGDPAERLKIAQHLQTCATCSVAVLEFQTVRGMLSEWRPPASQLGFRIVQDAEVEPPPAKLGSWVPTWRPGGWAQAAAAVLLFVAGAAVSQLNVHYGDGALTVSTRSAEPDMPAVRNASIELPPSPVESGPGQAATSKSDDVEQLLQRVRSMIEQSEIRQQRELALRLSQVAREVDTQHQADLLRIQQDFGDQQNLMEYLVRTSGGVK